MLSLEPEAAGVGTPIDTTLAVFHSASDVMGLVL